MIPEQVKELMAGDVVAYEENGHRDIFIYTGKPYPNSKIGALPGSCKMQLEGKVPKTPISYSAKFCEKVSEKEAAQYKSFYESVVSLKKEGVKKEEIQKEKKPEKKPAPRKRLEKFKRSLLCKLTQEEAIKKYKELGKREAKRMELMRELSIMSDDLKGVKEQISGVQREINSLAQIAETLEETRDVDCEKLVDEKTRIVTIKRMDTREIIEERKLNDSELQTTFLKA